MQVKSNHKIAPRKMSSLKQTKFIQNQTSVRHSAMFDPTKNDQGNIMVDVNDNCLSCSGNNTFVLQAFKLACLN